MKTMTCPQMGGPATCDAKMKAESAEEMMNEGAKHVMMMAQKGEPAHQAIMKNMQEMQAHPETEDNKAWTAKFMADFAALPNEMV